MTDLSATIAPKSDQLNSDDLIGKTLTIEITGVKGVADQQQPIAISFKGDNGKPYKPCKSMRRVLVQVWGKDGNAYVGKKMTLYRDDKVVFGGIAVGGIRISHMSGIDAPITMALTANKQSRKPFTVKPLGNTAPKAAEAEAQAPLPPLSDDEWNELQNTINNSANKDELLEAKNKVMAASARMTDEQKKTANDLYKGMVDYFKKKQEEAANNGSDLFQEAAE
jgi:hypothetical protein